MNVSVSVAHMYVTKLGILKDAQVGVWRKQTVYDKKKIVTLLREGAKTDPKIKRIWDKMPDKNKKV